MNNALPISITLPEHFLEKESRSGYEVSEKLKKIWAVEIDLLCKLLSVCKKHGIKIQVFGGTLLGTVRHKGFIPWDDDLDVCMTRGEFEKLQNFADEFMHPYFLQTAFSDRRYFLPFARLRNSETTGATSNSSEYNNGIYVDIYILEGYVDSRPLWLLQTMLMRLTVKPVTLYYQDKPRNSSVSERMMRLTRPFVRLFCYEMWCRIYYRVLQMYTKSATRIGLRHEMSEQAKRYWLTKSQFEDTIWMPFEWLTVPVARDCNEILIHIYGEYMKFPPVSERGVWHEGKIHFEPEVPYREYFLKRGLLDNKS